MPNIKKTRGKDRDDQENEPPKKRKVVFSCDSCEVAFTTKKGLDRHRQESHGKSKDCYRCPRCAGVSLRRQGTAHGIDVTVEVAATIERVQLTGEV